jgi:hypothetical protein
MEFPGIPGIPLEFKRVLLTFVSFKKTYRMDAGISF